MRSMTGYGKAEYNEAGVSLVIELKTVNNRYLDVVTKYPRAFMKFDDLMRKLVAKKLSRGRVELMISFKETEEASKPVTVDLTLAKSYYDAFLKLKETFPELNGDYSISQLMRLPDVVTPTFEDDSEKYQEILENTLSLALDNLNAMRKVEGEKLKVDFETRIKTIEEIVENIEKRAPLIKEEYAKKLKQRITEALENIQIDEVRLLQEVALFADKSNIDEEITRLKSHISQFRDIIKTENAGKRLDFLVQEFNREANTICSKSNDVTITDFGLKLKCEIEKIREQIQNVE